MGYQALLFCPDEKTARSVAQVLSELDFAVTPCTEPFAAVKKLMGEHFDAVVVDCDNEQNATLLFKSARNTALNQSSLAVAVVEGQAGVAKAFRIGANLVLTKPINVEQAKGTLRVARGLLRKGEATKHAAPVPSAKPIVPVQLPAEPSRQTAFSGFSSAHTQDSTMPLAASETETQRAAVQESASLTAVAHSHIIETGAEPLEASERIAPPTITKSANTPVISSSSVQPKTDITANRAGFGTSAASAPAPAREAQASVSTDEKLPASVPRGEITEKAATLKESANSSDGPSEPMPTLTFGGTVGSTSESAGSGKKKILLVGTAAVLLIAAGGYAAWMHWGHPSDATVPDHIVDSPVNAPVANPRVAPRPAPTAAPTAVSPVADTRTPATAGKVPDHASKSPAATQSSKPSPSSPAASKAVPPKEDEAPIVIKNQPSKLRTKPVAVTDAPALSMAGIAPAGNGGLPNLLDSPSNAPTPVLQTLSVSQGVSQGLILKKVQPKYPSNSLRLRVEGAVQLLATISKAGNISSVKILTGDPQLAQAAVDAVKQWKYKPYLLNGSAVEIQTQITVNFKLPN
jgi:periplasmic protein TonB